MIPPILRVIRMPGIRIARLTRDEILEELVKTFINATIWTIRMEETYSEMDGSGLWGKDNGNCD